MPPASGAMAASRRSRSAFTADGLSLLFSARKSQLYRHRPIAEASEGCVPVRDDATKVSSPPPEEARTLRPEDFAMLLGAPAAAPAHNGHGLFLCADAQRYAAGPGAAAAGPARRPAPARRQVAVSQPRRAQRISTREERGGAL